MKTLALFSLIVLAACANPQATPNPMSVPNVLQSITQTRDTAGTYIYITGGFYDGAAVGETATFIVTPDDQVICTFQIDPVFEGDPNGTTVTAHRLRSRGSYAALSAILVPNVEAVEIEFSASFTVETGSRGSVTTTRTGAGDPRLTRLAAFFTARPTPCWQFG